MVSSCVMQADQQRRTTSYLANGGTVELPQGENVHYEVELGVVVGQKTRDVTARQAMDHVAGYTLAIDM